MAINKKLIHFNSFSNFNSKGLSANATNTSWTKGVDGPTFDDSMASVEGYVPLEVKYHSIAFIKDTQQIWTHGQLYDCSNEVNFGIGDGLDLDETGEVDLIKVISKDGSIYIDSEGLSTSASLIPSNTFDEDSTIQNDLTKLDAYLGQLSSDFGELEDSSLQIILDSENNEYTIVNKSLKFNKGLTITNEGTSVDVNTDNSIKINDENKLSTNSTIVPAYAKIVDDYYGNFESNGVFHVFKCEIAGIYRISQNNATLPLTVYYYNTGNEHDDSLEHTNSTPNATYLLNRGESIEIPMDVDDHLHLYRFVNGTSTIEYKSTVQKELENLNTAIVNSGVEYEKGLILTNKKVSVYTDSSLGINDENQLYTNSSKIPSQNGELISSSDYTSIIQWTDDVDYIVVKQPSPAGLTFTKADNSTFTVNDSEDYVSSDRTLTSVDYTNAPMDPVIEYYKYSSIQSALDSKVDTIRIGTSEKKPGTIIKFDKDCFDFEDDKVTLGEIDYIDYYDQEISLSRRGVTDNSIDQQFGSIQINSLVSEGTPARIAFLEDFISGTTITLVDGDRLNIYKAEEISSGVFKYDKNSGWFTLSNGDSVKLHLSENQKIILRAADNVSSVTLNLVGEAKNDILTAIQNTSENVFQNTVNPDDITSLVNVHKGLVYSQEANAIGVDINQVAAMNPDIASLRIVGDYSLAMYSDINNVASRKNRKNKNPYILPQVIHVNERSSVSLTGSEQGDVYIKKVEGDLRRGSVLTLITDFQSNPSYQFIEDCYVLVEGKDPDSAIDVTFYNIIGKSLDQLQVMLTGGSDDGGQLVTVARCDIEDARVKSEGNFETIYFCTNANYIYYAGVGYGSGASVVNPAGLTTIFKSNYANRTVPYSSTDVATNNANNFQTTISSRIAITDNLTDSNNIRSNVADYIAPISNNIPGNAWMIDKNGVLMTPYKILTMKNSNLVMGNNYEILDTGGNANIITTNADMVKIMRGIVNARTGVYQTSDMLALTDRQYMSIGVDYVDGSRNKMQIWGGSIEPAGGEYTWKETMLGFKISLPEVSRNIVNGTIATKTRNQNIISFGTDPALQLTSGEHVIHIVYPYNGNKGNIGIYYNSTSTVTSTQPTDIWDIDDEGKAKELSIEFGQKDTGVPYLNINGQDSGINFTTAFGQKMDYSGIYIGSMASSNSINRVTMPVDYNIYLQS